MRTVFIYSILLLAKIVGAAEPPLGWYETHRIPAAEAFPSVEAQKCPLVKK
jgi:hypothetical protein